MSTEIIPEEATEIMTIMSGHSLSSSEDPPMEEWSSLILAQMALNKKRKLYSEGLYDPGSGELCAKYIPLSDSSVYRHPYYLYPSIQNPGIEDALLESEDVFVYPKDGQKRYLDLCNEMDQHVVTLFHEGLLEDVINLSYYCVNSQGVRAMSLALEYNDNVKTFILTDCFINTDACFHLGEMLKMNVTLYELDLSGCRIGPEGLRYFLPGLEKNRTLCILNLNRNYLTDVGGQLFAAAVARRLGVKRIYLSYNSLGSTTATALTEAFETHNDFTHIDFSWNYFFSLVGTLSMLNSLAENTKLQELDLSWNSLAGIKFAGAIKKIMPNLTVLKLNNNNFQGEDIELLVANMTKAKKLRLFSLANNPLTVKDAFKVIGKMKFAACKIQRLELDNIIVNEKFLEMLDKIKNMKSKKNVVITYGDLERSHKASLKDMKLIVFNRLLYLTEIKPRPKKRVDVPLIILRLVKDKVENMEPKRFAYLLRDRGAVVDTDLLENMALAFPGPVVKKVQSMNMVAVADYVKRLLPDRKLPPTPPPTILPPPPPPPKKGAKK